MSPTIVVSTNPALAHGEIGILASSPRIRSVTVHAVVEPLSSGAREIPTLVVSYLVVVRRAYESVPQARGAGAPVDSKHLFLPANVIARGNVVSTTDLLDHPLAVTAPSGLASRDYFVIAVQKFTQQCLPQQPAETWKLLGLLRITIG